MSKIWIIARHDFTATVRRKGYLLMTFGMPVIFGVLALLAAAPTYLMLHAHEPEVQHLNVVDRTDGLLSRKADRMKQRIQEVARTGGQAAARKEINSFLQYKLGSPITLLKDEAAARAELQKGEIPFYYLIDSDYLKTGKVLAYTREDEPSWVTGAGADTLRHVLIDGMLADQPAESLLARVKQPIDLQVMSVNGDGSVQPRRPFASLLQNTVPYAFAVILMLCIFMTTGYLLQSLTEEKASRTLELLLSCAAPRDLLLGKLIGLGGAGLLQFLLWLSVALVPVLLFTTLAIGAGTLTLMLVYFLLGFVLFGCLTFAVACLANTSREGQQLASLWALAAAVPVLLSPLIVTGPNSLLARVLSFFPLTSPVTMILRVATHRAYWVDLPLSILVLVAAIVFLVGMAANLLRLSMLLRGKFPGLGELLRAVRA